MFLVNSYMASQSVDNSNLANTGKHSASLLLLGAVKRVLFGVGADVSQTDFMSQVCFTCICPSSETVTKKTGRASHGEGCFCHWRKAGQEELINFVDVAFFFTTSHSASLDHRKVRKCYFHILGWRQQKQWVFPSTPMLGKPRHTSIWRGGKRSNFYFYNPPPYLYFNVMVFAGISN